MSTASCHLHDIFISGNFWGVQQGTAQPARDIVSCPAHGSDHHVITGLRKALLYIRDIASIVQVLACSKRCLIAAFKLEGICSKAQQTGAGLLTDLSANVCYPGLHQ